MKNFEKDTQEQPSNAPQNPLTNDTAQQPATVFDEQLGGPIVNEPPEEGVMQPVEEDTLAASEEPESKATDHHAQKRVKKLKKRFKKAKEQFAKLKKSLKKAKGKKKTKKLRKKLKAAKAKRKELKKAMKEAEQLAA